MAIRITPINPEGLAHVLAHMRAGDREEVFACRFDDDEAWLAEEILACQVRAPVSGLCLAPDGEPVAMFGAYARTPTCVECAMIATERWPDVGLPFTRWILRKAVPLLAQEGYVRAEARALYTHKKARGWLKRLGARQECLVRNFGRGQETFVQYAMQLGA